MLTFTFNIVLLSFTLAQNASKNLTNELHQITQTTSLKGFGIVVFTSDSLLYRHGFGQASSTEKYAANTKQKIASLSKLFIGVAVMKAQEMGLLKLDDPVNDYLPFELVNPYHPNQTISIRHLATHTAGLAKSIEYDLKAIYAPTKIPKVSKELPFGLRKLIFNRYINTINNNESLSLVDFLSNLYATDGEWYDKKNFINALPGTKTIYSNSGASLLALIIEQASGITYTDFVKQHILDPLGMTSTSFDFQNDTLIASPSTLYHAGMEVPNDFNLLVYPAGGVVSTITDFARFMQAITQGLKGESPLLSTSSIQELLRPQLGNKEHGILWEVTESGYIGHRGDILGVTTFAYYHLEKEVGYILFSNTAGTKSIDQDIARVKQVVKKYYFE